MRKITLIIGNAGSGKSYLAKQLAQVDDSVIVDDPRDFSEIERAIADSERNIIVCDCFLCEPAARKKAEQKILAILPEAQLQWIFFENNPHKCISNAIYRQDGRNVTGSIRRFARSYEIPCDIVSLSIWQPA